MFPLGTVRVVEDIHHSLFTVVFLISYGFHYTCLDDWNVSVVRRNTNISKGNENIICVTFFSTKTVKVLWNIKPLFFPQFLRSDSIVGGLDESHSFMLNQELGPPPLVVRYVLGLLSSSHVCLCRHRESKVHLLLTPLVSKDKPTWSF